MRKQSGRSGWVKVNLTSQTMALAAGLAVLTGCASVGDRWQQAGHSERQIKADLRACEREAETDTLAARGETRSSYAADRSGTGWSGGTDNPMRLADRSDAAKDFAKAVRRCMTAQGYTEAND
ncbi:MAG: hypothetical protein KDE14_02840 [Rhodobacteraceae bacterium]|nr:hypothetical protein [Paracoccaceae bacterium]